MAAAFRLAAEHTHQQQQHSQDTAQILMHGRRDELMQLRCVSLPAAVLRRTPRHIPPSPDWVFFKLPKMYFDASTAVWRFCADPCVYFFRLGGFLP